MLSTTMPVAKRLSVMPPFLNDSKKPGPTCRPMQYTKRIRPKSCRKFKVDIVPVKPKCPAKMPANSTNVTPNEIPKNLILPR